MPPPERSAVLPSSVVRRDASPKPKLPAPPISVSRAPPVRCAPPPSSVATLLKIPDGKLANEPTWQPDNALMPPPRTALLALIVTSVSSTTEAPAPLQRRPPPFVAWFDTRRVAPSIQTVVETPSSVSATDSPPPSVAVFDSTRTSSSNRKLLLRSSSPPPDPLSPPVTRRFCNVTTCPAATASIRKTGPGVAVPLSKNVVPVGLVAEHELYPPTISML